MARDLRNAVEELPRRRRRATRSDPLEAKQASSPVQQVSIPDSSQYHSHVDRDAMPLDISPLQSNNNSLDMPTGSPLSHYSRLNYPQGGGHDGCTAVQCPDILDIDTLSNLRKPISIVSPATPRATEAVLTMCHR